MGNLNILLTMLTFYDSRIEFPKRSPPRRKRHYIVLSRLKCSMKLILSDGELNILF